MERPTSVTAHSYTTAVLVDCAHISSRVSPQQCFKLWKRCLSASLILSKQSEHLRALVPYTWHHATVAHFRNTHAVPIEFMRRPWHHCLNRGNGVRVDLEKCHDNFDVLALLSRIAPADLQATPHLDLVPGLARISTQHNLAPAHAAAAVSIV